jgi:hypothetical protein
MCQRGTGSAIVRRRTIAPRTYADVDAWRR